MPGLLEYMRDAKIAHNAALIEESKELSAILTASVKTASRNAIRTRAPRS